MSLMLFDYSSYNCDRLIFHLQPKIAYFDWEDW